MTLPQVPVPHVALIAQNVPMPQLASLAKLEANSRLINHVPLATQVVLAAHPPNV